MFKGLSNLASLMKNAQGIGAKMQAMTEELKQKRVSGKAGGGMVEVEVNGLGQALRVTIDPDLIARQDKEMIEELLPAAINAAIAQAKELHAEALQGATGGLDIPGMKDMIAKVTGSDTGEIKE